MGDNDNGSVTLVKNAFFLYLLVIYDTIILYWIIFFCLI